MPRPLVMFWSSVLVLLLTTLAAPQLSAQNPEKNGSEKSVRFEVYEFGALNMYDASFTETPGLESCCADYTIEQMLTGGGAFGMIFGLSDGFYLDVGLGLESFGSSITGEGNKSIVVRGDSVAARFDNIVEYSMTIAMLEAGVRLKPVGNLILRAGGTAGVPINPSFIAREKLIAPAILVDDEDADREASGDLLEASSFWWGLYGGVGYEISMGSANEVFLTPEVSWHFSPASLITTDDWTVSSLRLGLRLAFLFNKDRPNSQPVAIAAAPAKAAPTPVLEATLTAGLSLLCYNESGTEENCVDVKVERIDLGSNAALLNYIFFEEGLAVLPARYRMIGSGMTADFSESRIRGEALDVYYELLNIVGRRLRENGSARLSIVGCHDGSVTEEGVEKLSMNRARVVRDYLVETWGISESRLELVGRALPENPSRRDNSDGDAENRRVELLSDDWAILKPLVREQTVLNLSLPFLEFAPTVNSNRGLKGWSIEVSQEGTPIRTLSGLGEPPAKVRWSPAPGDIPTDNPISFSMNLEDNQGKITKTSTANIDVTVVESSTSISVETYNLIIFPFDASRLSASHDRIIALINGHLTATSLVDVTGHTDRIGEADYNLNLSQERAKNVASKLAYSPKRVEGMGDKTLLFDNATPEGRFYCRTVNVRIQD